MRRREEVRVHVDAGRRVHDLARAGGGVARARFFPVFFAVSAAAAFFARSLSFSFARRAFSFARASRPGAVIS